MLAQCCLYLSNIWSCSKSHLLCALKWYWWFMLNLYYAICKVSPIISLSPLSTQFLYTIHREISRIRFLKSCGYPEFYNQLIFVPVYCVYDLNLSSFTHVSVYIWRKKSIAYLLVPLIRMSLVRTTAMVKWALNCRGCHYFAGVLDQAR